MTTKVHFYMTIDSPNSDGAEHGPTSAMLIFRNFPEDLTDLARHMLP